MESKDKKEMTLTNKLIRKIFELESSYPILENLREFLHSYGPARFKKGEKVWGVHFTPGEIVSVYKEKKQRMYLVKCVRIKEYHVVSDRDLLVMSDGEL
jgi:hypothetical protein